MNEYVLPILSGGAILAIVGGAWWLKRNPQALATVKTDASDLESRIAALEGKSSAPPTAAASPITVHVNIPAAPAAATSAPPAPAPAPVAPPAAPAAPSVPLVSLIQQAKIMQAYGLTSELLCAIWSGSWNGSTDFQAFRQAAGLTRQIVNPALQLLDVRGQPIAPTSAPSSSAPNPYVWNAPLFAAASGWWQAFPSQSAPPYEFTMNPGTGAGYAVGTTSQGQGNLTCTITAKTGGSFPTDGSTFNVAAPTDCVLAVNGVGTVQLMKR
jgi:hypothetical protein